MTQPATPNPAPLRRRTVLSAITLAWPLAGTAATEVLGAGATFPSKLYARWAQQYALMGRPVVRYQPTGSGDGIKQAAARTVAFAGTDSALNPKELEQRKLVQIPTCIGGLVPVVHGFEHNRLKLSGELLAEILLGQVERWDDPRIAALNKGLSLPNRRIVRVVRADKSGSTESFSRYLAAQHPAFAKAPGISPLPAWPGEVLAAEGNDGVSDLVQKTPGAIGYVSFDRVLADKLAAVQLRNREGQWVSASEASFRSAILNSELGRGGADTTPLLDLGGTDTWPLTQTTFVLLDAAPPTAAAAEPALRFWYWCFMRGDALTKGTGFAALPTATQARLANRFAEVKPQDGQRPVYQNV